MVLIQISWRVATYFFHLMTHRISCTFIYGFIVKQVCFVPRHPEIGFLCNRNLQWSAKFSCFHLFTVPHWDFYHYLYNYLSLTLSKLGHEHLRHYFVFSSQQQLIVTLFPCILQSTSNLLLWSKFLTAYYLISILVCISKTLRAHLKTIIILLQEGGSLLRAREWALV